MRRQKVPATASAGQISHATAAGSNRMGSKVKGHPTGGLSGTAPA